MTSSHISYKARTFLQSLDLRFSLTTWASEKPGSRFVHVICSAPEEYLSCALLLLESTGSVSLIGGRSTDFPRVLCSPARTEWAHVMASPCALTGCCQNSWLEDEDWEKIGGTC